MSEPKYPHGAPYEVEIVEARRHSRDACGRSHTQPFHDGPRESR